MKINEDMDMDMAIEMYMDIMMDSMRDMMSIWPGLDYRTLYGPVEPCSRKGGLARHLTWLCDSIESA